MSKSKGGSKGAAASSSSASASAGGGGAAESALVAQLKLASEKPLQHRAQGLTALTSLLMGSWMNAESNAVATRTLLPILREPASFLNHFAAIKEENIQPYLSVYPALINHHFQLLHKNGLDKPNSALLTTIVRLMLHPLQKIRLPVVNMMRDTLARAIGSKYLEGLTEALLHVFHYLLYTKDPAALSAPSAPFIWRRAFYTLVAPAHASPSLVPLALFLAHDPLLVNHEARNWHAGATHLKDVITIWATQPTAEQMALNPQAHIKKNGKIAKQRKAVCEMIEKAMPQVQKMLFSERGLLEAEGSILPPSPATPASSPQAVTSPTAANGSLTEVDEAGRSERQRKTSVSLLLSLFRTFPTAALTSFYSPLLSLLSHPSFSNLTAESVAIFNTPEGQLCEFVASGEFKAVVADNKKQRPADWTEKDEELERRAAEARAKQAAAAAARKPAAKAPAGGKPGAKPAAGGKSAPLTGAAKVEAEQKKRMYEQSALRAKLTVAKKQVEPVLGLFGQLALRLPKLVHDRMLASLLPKVTGLFSNEIVRQSALETHALLSEALDGHAARVGTRLALSVQMLLLQGDKAFSVPLNKRILANTILYLKLAAEKKPFSPATFLYVYPLLQATIQRSVDAEAEEVPKKKAAAAAAAPADEEDEEEATPSEQKSSTGDEDADFEEEEEKEEKSDDAAPASRRIKVDPIDVGDADEPLGPGLQLSVQNAVELVEIHSNPQLHEERKEEEKSSEEDKVVAGEASFPVASMYSSLLHLLSHVQRLYKPALDALINLSSGRGIRPADVLPLLDVEGVLHTNKLVRLHALEACEKLHCFKPEAAADRVSDVPHFRLFTQRMWIGCHDSHPDASAKASSIWESFQLELDPSYLPDLIQLLTMEASVIRGSVARSIASAIQLHPSETSSTMGQLTELFVSSPDEKLNQGPLGVRQATKHIFRWHTRSGVAQCIGACTDSLGEAEILQSLFTFFVAHGLLELNDKVWEDMLASTLRIINVHGKQFMSTILPMLEEVLARDMEKQARTQQWSEAEEAANDRLREGVILAMGTLARHMDENDESLVGVVDSLVESLRTPSHSVQKSVAECLPPLMAFPHVSENAGKWIDLLLQRLKKGEEYGERKGAAFGLAGMVKGLKLASLKKYSILDQLSAMVQDKSSAKARQGALFAYERLFFELGHRFEPYVVHILPHLLACSGDSNSDVRDATADAARIIMSHLTAMGIKMVLPLVLKALDEKAWRTKLESIELISAMAYCSPQQLSACLPMIVPRLLEVNTDANSKVQEASRSALKEISSQIRNPEILSLVPILLHALLDPTTHTKRALQELMRTSFVHSVDPPSLALIIPILRRGLKGRTAITKKMAAQVVGSMCSLIGDVKDILPYASTLLKYLKVALTDPSPEVRAVTAKAMASLYKGIVEQEVEGFVDLREWLLETLRADNTTPTIRSGCAQGLAQLLAVQGLEATSQLLPTLFSETRSEKAVVREGFYDVLGFLPAAFGDIFSIFVADALPVIVEGLADEIGPVREAALEAGQALVLAFAQSKTDLLLPALEDGIVSSDWRIRLSSVQLLGVMLLRLAGVSAKMILGANNASEEGEEEKNVSTICTREQEAHIESVLGTDRRNRLFATVYLMRCDVFPSVADVAFRVWSSVVSNSPRMLTTILSVLMSIIISDLASDQEERQHAAGRTLGDLCNRMGDYILSEIVPILQARLVSDDKFTRQGVCLGLSEVMASSRKNDLAAYMSDIIPSVRDALCDNEELVRRAAGTCFSTLLRCLGAKRTVDDIVPALMHSLDQEEGDDFKTGLVLEGMRVVLGINSSDVLPYLIPQLIQPPLTLFHAKALAFLSPNFTKGFIRYVENVTHALIDGISRANEDEIEEMKTACSQVVQCVSQDCVHQFVNVLEETCTANKKDVVKLAVAHLVASFTANTRTNFDSHLPLLLQLLLRLFVESNEAVRTAGWEAMDVMMKSVSDERAAKHISFVRSVFADIAFDSASGKRRKEIAGFCRPKGIQPLLPMFQYGLMHGTPSVRVDSADGLSDLVSYTSETALGPFVIKMTGPLIRIVGDRFPAEVKAAILNTLYLLIRKTPKQLKPFLPQLQTTFLKSIADSSAIVRSRGSLALAELLTDPKRASTVLGELGNSASGDVSAPLQTSYLQSMVGIITNPAVGPNLAPETLAKAVAVAKRMINNDRDTVRRQSAKIMAVCAPHMSQEEFDSLVQDSLLRPADSFAQMFEKDGVLLALQALVRTSGDKVDAFGRDKLISYATSFLKDDHTTVICSAIHTLGELMVHAAKQGDVPTVASIAGSIAPFIQSEVTQLRQDAAARFQLLGEASMEASVAVYDLVVPGLVHRAQDPNGPVRQSVVGAMHTLFQFHITGGEGAEKSEKLVSSYYARASKKDASAATAMTLFVKKSVAKAKPSEVPNELWNSNTIGENIQEDNDSDDE